MRVALFEHDISTYDAIGHLARTQAEVVDTLVERAGKVCGVDSRDGGREEKTSALNESRKTSMTHTCVKDAVPHLASYLCTFPVDTQAYTIPLLVVVAG